MKAGGQFSAQVAAALAQGDTIGAIRLIRESGGQGLREALAAVEAYSTRQHGSPGSVASNAQADIRTALRPATAIEAFKRTHAAHPDMDSKSAKQAVDALRRHASMAAAGTATQARAVQAKAERTPTVVEGDHGGYGAVFVAIAAAMGALAWWWLGS